MACWNNYGYKLIEFCKNNEIYIVNSRFGSDKNIGGTTCKNSSTVDYGLATTNVFRILQNFDVIVFAIFIQMYTILYRFLFHIVIRNQPTVV